MEGLCPCGHEPTDSIVPVSYLVGAKGDWDFQISDQVKNPDETDI